MSPLLRYLDLLGQDVFFVPCAWGTKRPILTYADRPFEETQTPQYRALFAAEPRNIAVYLGKASGGLCAIDFDADADLAAFLALNPNLAHTTRSRGSRGAMLWLRIDGDYPNSCNPDHRHFEWRADKRLSTIHGRQPRLPPGSLPPRPNPPRRPHQPRRNPPHPIPTPTHKFVVQQVRSAGFSLSQSFVRSAGFSLSVFPSA